MEAGRSGVSGAVAVCRVAEVYADVYAPVQVLRHFTVERCAMATPYTSHTALQHV